MQLGSYDGGSGGVGGMVPNRAEMRTQDKRRECGWVHVLAGGRGTTYPKSWAFGKKEPRQQKQTSKMRQKKKKCSKSQKRGERSKRHDYSVVLRSGMKKCARGNLKGGGNAYEKEPEESLHEKKKLGIEEERQQLQNNWQPA